jgi:pimeloyl-ACP methyl ester carboxylesterase
MKRAYIDTPEGQVHYRTEGSGEPVLLLHKVGSSSDQYTDMLPVLGKSYRAIAMDILGCGNSDLPPYEYQLEDYVRNTMHFLDALKIKKTNIVGYLLEASFAVEMAVTYPERVNKIVLWDCIYKEQKAREKAQDDFRNKRMEFKPDGSHLIDLWKSRFSQPSMNLEMVQRSVVDYLRSGLGARADDLHRALFSYDIEPKLPKIKSPTLLLYSRGDSEFSRLEATKKLIPRCQIRIIEDVLFFPFWEKPEELARAIMEFLQNPVF